MCRLKRKDKIWGGKARFELYLVVCCIGLDPTVDVDVNVDVGPRSATLRLVDLAFGADKADLPQTQHVTSPNYFAFSMHNHIP